MSKRYLFFFTIFFAAGLGYAVYQQNVFEETNLLVLCIPMILLLGIGFCTHHLPTAVFSCVGLLASQIFLQSYTDILVKPLEVLQENSAIITAEVCDFPDLYEDSQRVEVLVNAESAGIKNYPLKNFRVFLYLPLTDFSLQPGDTLRVKTSFYLPTAAEGFDRKQYQASQGRFLQASSTKFEDELILERSSAEKIPIRYFPITFAEHWKEQILSKFPTREGGFLISLLLGDRNHLSDFDYQAIKKSGLSHIIAVSGMHLMFLVAFVTKVFGKRFGTILSVPVVLFFACMAGNSPSVMRASIMVVASAIAFLCMDEVDSLTVLALSLMILLLYNPYSIASTSLQLSYLSTLGLILYAQRVQTFLLKPFERCSRKVKKWVAIGVTPISCSFCALLFTTPVLVCTFDSVTLLSPLSNLMVLGVLSILFICGFLFCIVGLFTTLLDGILVPIITALIQYILWVAEFCADFWWYLLNWQDTFAKVAIFTICLMILVIIFHQYSKPKFTLPILCVILIGAIYHNADRILHTTTITMHPVGNGQMITISAGREHLSVIDCGSGSNRDAAEILRDYMLWNDFEEIGTFVLTAVDKTHARAFPDIVAQYPIQKIILPTGLQENDFTKSIRQIISEKQIPCTDWKQAGESPLSLEGLDCTLIGGTNRKLGVRLLLDDGDFLILHSFTQKMMDELLQQMPLQCDRLVLSASNLEKVKLLQTALEILCPDELLFPAGADTIPEKLFGVPTRSTYLEGEIILRTSRKIG